MAATARQAEILIQAKRQQVRGHRGRPCPGRIRQRKASPQRRPGHYGLGQRKNQGLRRPQQAADLTAGNSNTSSATRQPRPGGGVHPLTPEVHAGGTQGLPDDRETIRSGSAGDRAERDQPTLAPRRAAASAWISKHRRTVRDYDPLPESHEAMILRAMTALMIRPLVTQAPRPD
jgi:hypothetical protein